MKPIHGLIPALFLLAHSPLFAADDIEPVRFGDAEVVYDLEQKESGMAILTLSALVPETNNSLRGLKNSDRRRLGKLGQLLYQCKLMLYQTQKSAALANSKDPILISKNFSLFTGVNGSLSADERMGIRVQALKSVDEGSLFTASLGQGDSQAGAWETIGENVAINLKHFDVNLLNESDVVQTSDNIDIIVRFPVFQVAKPVNQWIYNFDLRDFNQAVRHADAISTPAKLVELIDHGS